MATPPPIMLALPGPAMPPLNFDPPGEGAAGDVNRLTIKGMPLYLQPQRPEGEDTPHTVLTAGSVWDCSVVLAKYLDQCSIRGNCWVKGKRVLEVGDTGPATQHQT
eukprot:comp18672_c0_seq2/m.20345 comp18672_c0_seq2/g.20345  ORF comp18672_c0_seq2/g.20345 comp18672_c0_seq2/m.20345 type:complete len:106 (-) comp18672_c0_seq2:722-1039(-)